jgi:hypothetical protein
MKEKIIKQFIIDAIISFIYWTVVLTPYMVLVVKTNIKQYIAWLSMQALLVPPLGAIFSIIARKIKR